jgi:hypothetical protein
MTMENLVCLPARGVFPRSSSLLRFLSLRIRGLDRAQRLGLLGLEDEVFGSSALLARDLVEDLFLGLERRRVWAETAR